MCEVELEKLARQIESDPLTEPQVIVFSGPNCSGDRLSIERATKEDIATLPDRRTDTWFYTKRVFQSMIIPFNIRVTQIRVAESWPNSTFNDVSCQTGVHPDALGLTYDEWIHGGSPIRSPNSGYRSRYQIFTNETKPGQWLQISGTNAFRDITYTDAWIKTGRSDTTFIPHPTMGGWSACQQYTDYYFCNWYDWFPLYWKVESSLDGPRVLNFPSWTIRTGVGRFVNSWYPSCPDSFTALFAPNQFEVEVIKPWSQYVAERCMKVYSSYLIGYDIDWSIAGTPQSSICDRHFVRTFTNVDGGTSEAPATFCQDANLPDEYRVYCSCADATTDVTKAKNPVCLDEVCALSGYQTKEMLDRTCDTAFCSAEMESNAGVFVGADKLSVYCDGQVYKIDPDTPAQAATDATIDKVTVRETPYYQYAALGVCLFTAVIIAGTKIHWGAGLILLAATVIFLVFMPSWLK